AKAGGSTSNANQSVEGSQTAASAAVLATLGASVAPGGAVTLTKGGKAVAQLKAGRYRIVVADSSSSDGFVLRGLKRSALTLTGAAFTGHRTVTVTLTTGQWLYYGSAARK